MSNQGSEEFTQLVVLCTELATYVDQLVDKVANLEDIANYHERQISTLQEEVLRLNRIVDTW